MWAAANKVALFLWNREARRKRKTHEIPREAWAMRCRTLLHSNKATLGMPADHTQSLQNIPPPFKTH
jgi:hypothetical protein